MASPRHVVLGNPGGQRVALFQNALARLGHAPARVVAWLDLLAGRDRLDAHVRDGDVVRVESPGQDFEVERLLLLAGADDAESEAAFARATPAELLALAEDRGRILWPRQWYLGFRAALRAVAAQLAACPPHVLVGDPEAVAVMFDKVACHEALRAAGVAVAPSLGAPRSFDELAARMREARCPRVFVKLAHGSSASGVVAWRTDGARHQAVTTVEAAPDGALYNSLRLRTLTDARDIAALVDALCAHRAHAEAWLPKAGVGGRTFDLRVLVIEGRARHVVVRASRSPITNLHLGNERGDAEAVRRKAGAVAWAAAMRGCEAAAGCFPRQLHAGVDVMFTADFRRHAVLEVNAFGDLLPGVLHEGEGTHEAEALAALRGRASRR